MIDDEDSPSPRRGSFDEFIDSMGDAMDAEELRTALNDVASSSRKTTGKSGWTSSEEEADPMEEEDEDTGGMSFREHRKAHYNEFLKVKELRQKGSVLDDEEEDDASAKENDGTCDSSSSLSAGVKCLDIDGDNTTTTLPQQSSSPPANGT
ncbi:protein phosphatase inhibitor 2-like [Melia azedarach]|nr:protein phosphatase inhibitor 2-like [Melia azedarach]